MFLATHLTRCAKHLVTRLYIFRHVSHFIYIYVLPFYHFTILPRLIVEYLFITILMKFVQRTQHVRKRRVQVYEYYDEPLYLPRFYIYLGRSRWNDRLKATGPTWGESWLRRTFERCIRHDYHIGVGRVRPREMEGPNRRRATWRRRHIRFGEQTCVLTNVSGDNLALCLSFQPSPPFAFRRPRPQIPLQIISIYAKHRDRAKPLLCRII